MSDGGSPPRTIAFWNFLRVSTIWSMRCPSIHIGSMAFSWLKPVYRVSLIYHLPTADILRCVSCLTTIVLLSFRYQRVKNVSSLWRQLYGFCNLRWRKCRSLLCSCSDLPLWLMRFQLGILLTDVSQWSLFLSPFDVNYFIYNKHVLHFCLMHHTLLLAPFVIDKPIRIVVLFWFM